MPEPSIPQPVAGARATTDTSQSAVDPALPDDPKTLQILTTEHWSLLSARSLAYNEAFTRASMLLSFLAMSFVALALLAQGMGFTREMLVIAAIVFGFDMVVGVTTFARVIGANLDDLRAMHGMARIRHGYTQIAPAVAPYFVTPTNDDMTSVLSSYVSIPPGSLVRDILHGLSTSLGLVGLVVSLLGGTLAAVIVLALGGSSLVAVIAAALGAITVFAVGARWALVVINRVERETPTLFPAPSSKAPTG